LASADIIVPNLVPGKRYRMVVETANSAGQINVGSTSVPSIEFVVPSANQLLSEYTPTYSVRVDNYPARQGAEISRTPQPSIIHPATGYWSAWTNVALSKACNNTVLTYGSGTSKYLFRFASTAGAPPVGMDFRASGISSGGSDYYDNLIFTRTPDDPGNGNIVATARLQSANYDFPNQNNATDARWRTQNGRHWGAADLASTAGNSKPTLRWTEQTRSWIDTTPAPTPVPDKVVYAQHPAYSITTVTVSVPNSLKLENNVQNNQRVVEIPVFFYIENGIFKDMSNNVMTGEPPSITSVPGAIPVSGVNVNEPNVGVSQRSYRFTVARYTQINGLWQASWSQFDDLYESERIMRHVIYSRQAVL
jgi:hypothetical protein